MSDQPMDHGVSTLIAAALGHPSTWVDARPELEHEVVQAVVAAEAAEATESLERAPGASEIRLARPTAPRRRRVLTTALVAAVLVLAVVATFGVTLGSQSTDYGARLRAIGPESSASASVDVTRTDTGFRIVLDTVDLPALQPGEYFQAWLKSPGGTLVPIGTFSSGDGRVTLWSGVSPAAYPTMSVTVEAPDDDQTSSGRRVLVGELRAVG